MTSFIYYCYFFIWHYDVINIFCTQIPIFSKSFFFFFVFFVTFFVILYIRVIITVVA